MSIPIPAPFKWDATFTIGIELMDTEHQALFDGIQKLMDENNAENLSKALKVFEIHFYDENKLMADGGYGGAFKHAAIHENFLDNMRCWSLPVSPQCLNWARNWLVYHIKGLDFNYKGKVTPC